MPKNSKRARFATELELAYIAGLFDGEGCIQLIAFTTKTGWRLDSIRATVKMCDQQAIALIVEVFGGTVSMVRRTLPHRDQYAWHLYSRRETMEFLTAIRPFLRIKGPQVDVAEQFNTTFTGHNRKGRGSKVPVEVVERRLRLIDDCKRLKRAT